MPESNLEVTARLNSLWMALGDCERIQDREQLNQLRDIISRTLLNRIAISISEHGITPLSNLIEEVDWRGGL